MLNQKLRKARERKHWTIEKAAEAVGVSWLTYSRWENGLQRPQLTTLGMLCQAFGLSDDELGFAHQADEVSEQERAVLLSSETVTACMQPFEAVHTQPARSWNGGEERAAWTAGFLSGWTAAIAAGVTLLPTE